MLPNDTAYNAGKEKANDSKKCKLGIVMVTRNTVGDRRRWAWRRMGVALI